jgi:hypothetical protein
MFELKIEQEQYIMMIVHRIIHSNEVEKASQANAVVKNYNIKPKPHHFIFLLTF